MNLPTKHGFSMVTEAPVGRLRQPKATHALVDGPGVNGTLRRRRIRLILADDQPITLVGLDALFSRESEFLVLQRCTNGVEVVRAVIAQQPDVMLLNRDLPPTDAVTVLRTLKAEGAAVRTVLLSDRPNGDQFEWALRLGVYGVAFKTMDPRLVVDCVRDVFSGKRRLGHDALPADIPALTPPHGESGALTRRQFEVARAAASGLSNKELATQLGVSEGTIKNHLHAVYERLQLDGRLALLLYLKEKALA
jgi:two-component system nitrate/nitrite response regulator NarL